MSNSYCHYKLIAMTATVMFLGFSILNSLFLCVFETGNLAAACDIPLLEKYKISYILTIDSCPLPSKITHLPFVKTKFVQLCDIPREDILGYFEETCEFLRSAVEDEGGGNALVHW